MFDCKFCDGTGEVDENGNAVYPSDDRWAQIVDALGMVQGFIEASVPAEDARKALDTLNRLVR